MRILIELPTWLGDAVMTTPSIENILIKFNSAEFVFIGSEVSLALFENFPNSKKLVKFDKKITKLRDFSISLGKFDLFISYRSSYRTKFFMFFVNALKKHQFNKRHFDCGHQVERYNAFINEAISLNKSPGPLKLYNNISRSDFDSQDLIGINPGAQYGSAKRWTINGFQDVAFDLSQKYKIILFGSKNEEDICNEIENFLKSKGVTNFVNLCGKTNIQELISIIAKLKLFITGDSGPMHIAGAMKIATISIFGPTRHNETHQWGNNNSKIIRKKLSCQPCMKRICPLKHHNCMKFIKADEVLIETKKLLRKV